MKKLLLPAFLGTLFFTMCPMMFSCRKSESNKVISPPTNGHSLKFKTTVAGIASTGNPALINPVFNGVETADLTTKTLWKINGAAQ